jgi:hypothetical protein
VRFVVVLFEVEFIAVLFQVGENICVLVPLEPAMGPVEGFNLGGFIDISHQHVRCDGRVLPIEHRRALHYFLR